MDQGNQKKGTLFGLLILVAGFAGGLVFLAIIGIILSALGILNSWG
ncbi:MAG: hypothetical protein Q8Q24_01585 [bacterium]|nr:hypothetical protein [bacterium]